MTAIYNSFTIRTTDGDTFSASRPSEAVDWLHNLGRWHPQATAQESKQQYAASAKLWSGVAVTTLSAWRFLLGLQEAGFLSITWNKGEPHAL